MQPFVLRYPEVEALLAELHQVAPTTRIALMGRIKNLQRKGWPPGTNSGRGKPADYGFAALIELLLAFELAALRIPPDQAVGILRGLDWGKGKKHLARVGQHLADGLEDRTRPMFSLLGGGALLVFNPDGLDGLREGQGADKSLLGEPPWIAVEEDGELYDVLFTGPRFAAVNLTRLLIRAAFALEKIGGPDRRQFGAGVLDWVAGVPDPVDD
jgi:hypothetical protein